jgi:hypothetical protein
LDLNFSVLAMGARFVIGQEQLGEAAIANAGNGLSRRGRRRARASFRAVALRNAGLLPLDDFVFEPAHGFLAERDRFWKRASSYVRIDGAARLAGDALDFSTSKDSSDHARTH